MSRPGASATAECIPAAVTERSTARSTARNTARSKAHAAARWREQLVANTAFFVLFPGFFFYHTLLGNGIIGAVLGGYFSPMALLFTLPLGAVLLWRLKTQPSSSIGKYYSGFLLYFIVIVLCHTIAGANRLIVANHLLCILFMIQTFILFGVIDFSSRQFRLMAWLSLAAMSAIAFSYSVGGVFYLGALGIASDSDSLATYQGFARSYLFTVLPVIAFTRSLLLRMAIYAVATATLFVNTARSEFAALLFVIPVIELYLSRQKMLLILTVAVLGFALYLHMDQLIASLPDNRILELIDLRQSTSATKRHHLSQYAMHTIASHPLMGEFASYAPGYYAHNVLSAWVDLGLFGFVYLLGILVLPGLSMLVREFFAGRRRSDCILAFSLICVTLLLLMTAHFFTDMLIGASLGAYAQYRARRRRPGRSGRSVPAGIAPVSPPLPPLHRSP